MHRLVERTKMYTQDHTNRHVNNKMKRHFDYTFYSANYWYHGYCM